MGFRTLLGAVFALLLSLSNLQLDATRDVAFSLGTPAQAEDDGDDDDDDDGDDDDGGGDDRDDSDDGDDDDRDDRDDEDREDDGDGDEDEDDLFEDDPEWDAPANYPRFGSSRSDDADDTRRRAEITATGVSPEGLAALQRAGFTVIRQSPSTLLPGRLTLRLRTPEQRSDTANLQAARQLVPDAVFDFTHLFRPSVARDFARTLVGFPTARTCRVNQRVGMIDGAVAPHPSLATVRVTRRNFVIGASDANHGTAVASILAGRDPTGAALASGVHLHVATVIGRENAESVADAAALVEGLDWLAASGVRFVNISIAGPRNDVVEAAVRAAADRGVILVAAAGNAGREAPPRFPAAYEDVIAVSAIDRRGRPYLHGNRGEYVEIAAPGVDVWGALAGGDGALWTGTSFAAPFVTTALAIQAGEARIGDVADARAFLARAARDLGPKGRDPVFGAGLVQIPRC